MTAAISHFDPSDRAQVLSDGLIGGLLYTRLAAPGDSTSYKLAVGLSSFAAANYLYNTAIGPTLEDLTHPGRAIVDALQSDLEGTPQDAVVGNALLAAGGYAGYQGAKRAWKSRPQGDPDPEPAVEMTEAAPEAEAVEESTGEVILESLESVGEGLLDVAPELVFL